jgi:hypothetical protein
MLGSIVLADFNSDKQRNAEMWSSAGMSAFLIPVSAQEENGKMCNADILNFKEDVILAYLDPKH